MAGEEAQSGGKAKTGKKGGKGSSSSSFYANPGFAYLASLVADKECLSYTAILEGGADVCYAAGGYPLYAFYTPSMEDATQSAAVGCCPKNDKDLDLDDVADYCVEITEMATGCGTLASAGIAILLQDGVTWCCSDSDMMVGELPVDNGQVDMPMPTIPSNMTEPGDATPPPPGVEDDLSLRA